MSRTFGRGVMARPLRSRSVKASPGSGDGARRWPAYVRDYSGMSQSGNQRAMSSSQGSSRASWALRRSSSSRVARLRAGRGHEGVVGAALEVVDEVDRLAARRPRTRTPRPAGGRRSRRPAARRRRCSSPRPGRRGRRRAGSASGSRTRRRGSRPWCRSPRPCRRAAPRSRRTICLKSAVAIGWKTTPAHCFDFRPRPVSIVTFAVVIANRRSGAAPFSFPLRAQEPVEEAHG